MLYGRESRAALLVALVAAQSVPLSHAEVYTWEDESGRTRFSDQPPPNSEYERWRPPKHPNSSLQLAEPLERYGTASEGESTSSSRPDEASERAEQRARCQKYERSLARINERLEAGYREPTGNRLRARRRQLRSKRFHECR